MATETLQESTAETQEERAFQVSSVLGAKESTLSAPKRATLRPSDVEAKTTEDCATEKSRRERQRALIFPREHGAWGLLLVPLVTGAGIALRESRNAFPLLLLLTAALILFWLRTPIESLLGTSAIKVQTDEEFRDVLFVAAYLGVVAALSLGMLLWSGRNPLLWRIGAAAGLAFGAQALIKKLGRKARMLSEIVGTIGLTASAPAAYYVVTGKFGPTAWMLWLANLLFAGDQIHYVQLRIHTVRVEGFRAKLAQGWAFAVGQAVMTVAITLACVNGLMPAIASLAFSPLLFRGWYYFVQGPKPLVVRRLGWNELGLAVAFCVIFIASFTLTI
ncbi:MAG TPA: YwiC-like family protein [Candidatus Dormibacteraeota bacterium]|nr:YwiC-like family protein [Candidatus Dormibacteraeota bacterium]